MARILFVEDDPLVRHGLARVLAVGGHEVRACASLREGLEQAALFATELALLDVTLPDGTGVQCAAALRARGFAGAIVFLTAHGDPAQVEQAMAQGAQGYLVKPVTGAQLLPAIQAALAAARAGERERAALLSAVRNSREISAAVGVLSERHGWSLEDSFAHLRRAARSSGRKITEVAAETLRNKSGSAGTQ
ncbi:MAG: response regulator [Pseudomonadota bacterium]